MHIIYTFPQLIEARFCKRYKRFFVDVIYNHSVQTAHCPNTGSMKNLLQPGQRVWLSQSQNPKRKLLYTLEAVESEGNIVGVNTIRTNAIVYNALQKGLITRHVPNILSIQKEHQLIKGVRLDFLIQGHCGPLFIEVKNVTLKEGSKALFPDAVTTRGTKHALHLTKLAREGERCMLIFLVQRNDCSAFACANDIDPTYTQAIQEAQAAGVIIEAYQCNIDPSKNVLYLDTHPLDMS
ncbi:MAG: DNA/RNA nuclease SfsA [Alphaproteobacteria bacterium]|nr:DNA/RNA nuclease SfsA [Alphaproteobacteria bacterium]